ncbi:MAG: hypothetical protein ACLFU9_07890 [Candidatus Bathyarchaeia archaeon]
MEKVWIVNRESATYHDGMMEADHYFIVFIGLIFHQLNKNQE